MSGQFAGVLPKRILSACQAFKLLWAVLTHGLRAALSTLYALLLLLLGCRAEDCTGVEFYEGVVTHTRSHEGTHAFKYPVRMAVVDLDNPPHWWCSEPVARLSADAARVAAGTDGPVHVLTTPSCFGYDQNPIQVYYCADANGTCRRGICEVTNTPWNHHVYFAFVLDGAELPKPLHVSPLMDLKQRWRLRATPPSAHGLQVWVDVLSAEARAATPAQPDKAFLLRAYLELNQRSWPHARAERAASFEALWKYGLQPHRTAMRIYSNALLLLRNGIKFRDHPAPEYKQCVLDRMQDSGSCRGAGLPWWADNPRFPWCPAFAGHKAE